MDKLLNLLTRENITLALSIFGAIGTLFTFLTSYLSKRKNLKIKIIKSSYRTDMHMLLITLTFENRSVLPIAITSIKCFTDRQEFPLFEHPICVKEYAHSRGKEVVDRKFLYNINFPIDIQQLSAFSGSIVLELSQKELETLSTPLTLQVFSTRGKAQKIELKKDQIYGL